MIGLPGQIGQASPRRLVANREHEIHHRRAGTGEFMPALAAQPAYRQLKIF